MHRGMPTGPGPRNSSSVTSLVPSRTSQEVRLVTLELFLGPGPVSMRKKSHDKWACPRSIYRIPYCAYAMLRVATKFNAGKNCALSGKGRKLAAFWDVVMDLGSW